MKILVAESATGFARVLLPLLAADPRVTQIIGADHEDIDFRHPRFTQVLLEAGSAAVDPVLREVEVVIHLAGAAWLERTRRPLPGRAEAAKQLLQRAATANVARIVWLSSAAVYEIPPRAPVVAESHPRKVVDGIDEVADLVEVETWLDAFTQNHDRPAVVRLRPHLIAGARTRGPLNDLLALPYSMPLADRPRLQCVHEQDVARAIVDVLNLTGHGTYNLACHEAATLNEMKRIMHRWQLPLAFPVARQLWSWVHGRGGRAPAWLERMRYSLVLDSARARRELNWRPAYDSVAACVRAIEDKGHG